MALHRNVAESAKQLTAADQMHHLNATYSINRTLHQGGEFNDEGIQNICALYVNLRNKINKHNCLLTSGTKEVLAYNQMYVAY
jgi:hypothetical protein